MKVSLDTNMPDKPAGALKRLVRSFLRELRWASIEVANRGRIERGNNCSVGRRHEVYVPENMRLGSNISIGSHFLSQVNVVIGDECLLSSRVSLIGNDHDLANGTSAYFSGRTLPSTIVLEGDNFIGFGATILGNVTIGRGAIIGAMALVNRDVPADVIVAGVPARVIGMRMRANRAAARR